MRFFLVLIATATALVLAVYAGDRLGVFPIPSFFLPTLVLLVVSTGIIYRYLFKIDSGTFFVRIYVLTMVMKMLTYGAFNLIVILRDKASAVENVVFFMIAYLIFTAIEIGFLYRKIITKKDL